jgi:hypothetical protein
LKFLHMIATCPKYPTPAARKDVMLEAMGFPRVFATRLSGWMDCWFQDDNDVNTEGQLKAAHLVDLASGVLRQQLIHCTEATVAATRKARLVEELFFVFPRVRRLGMVWPRILGCVMEVMSSDPRSDYVQMGLELTQMLRRMRVDEVCVLPGLFCLRVEDLRQLRTGAEEHGHRSERRSHLPRLGSVVGKMPPQSPRREGSITAPPRSPKSPFVRKQTSKVDRATLPVTVGSPPRLSGKVPS